MRVILPLSCLAFVVAAACSAGSPAERASSRVEAHADGPATSVSCFRAIDLGVVGADCCSTPVDVNARGDVLVQSQDREEDGERALPARAFVWRDGTRITIPAPSGAEHVFANDMNDRGDVVGSVVVAGRSRPFVFRDGALTLLDLAGGISGIASAINESGVIAGGIDRDGGSRAVVWREGVPVEIPSLGESFAEKINEAGHVLGYFSLPSGAGRTFLWRGGDPVDLGTLGDDFAIGLALNERDQVVGYTGNPRTPGLTVAFLWDSGVMRELAPVTSSDSYAESINNTGVAVGSVEIGGRFPNVAVFRDGAMQSFGPGAGAYIGDIGWIVGAVDRDEFPFSTATVWHGGGSIDLGALAARGGDSLARKVNLRGDVVGDVDDQRSHEHATLWKFVCGEDGEEPGEQ